MNPFFQLSRIISLFILICLSCLTFGMLHNIADTYQILPPDFKKYSITNGAIAVETNWLNNFHRFSLFFFTETTDHRGRKVLRYKPETDAMTKLVYILFHRIPGSTTYTDFSTTDFVKPKGPEAANEIASLVAKIVFGLDGLAALVKESKETKENLMAQMEVIKKHETLGKNRATVAGLKTLNTAITNFEKTRDKKKLDQAKQVAFGSKKSPFSPETTKDLFDAFEIYSTKNQSLDAWLRNVQELLQLSMLKISPSDFATIVVDALHQSNPQNLDALYPENLVHMIWLGFLYKALEKASGNDEIKNRIAMQKYYETLGQLVNQKLDLPLEVNLPKSIKPLDAQEIVKEFLENPGLIADKLDSFLFYSIKSQLFPMLIGYANTNYKPFKKGDVQFSFPDCMENSLANFIRTMSYNLDFGTYKLATLERRLGIGLDEEHASKLDQFLKNPLDHDAWTTLVSNIPYVPYLQAGKNDGKSLEHSNKRTFMRVDDEVKQTYEQNGYYAITSPEQAVFELRPSLRAIIIVLDHLLGLDLFKENLAKEGFRPDFVAHYFKELCSKLHQECYYSLDPNAEEQDENIDIDRLDQEEKSDAKVYSFFNSTLSELNNQKLTHKFSTYAGHGEYELILPPTSPVELPPDFPNISFEVLLLITHVMDTLLENSKINSMQKFYSLFALPLYDPDYAFDLTRNLVEQPIDYPAFSLFLFNLANSQPDLSRRAQNLRKILNVSDDENFRIAMEKAALDLFFKKNIPSLLGTMINKQKLSNPQKILNTLLSLFLSLDTPHILNEFLGDEDAKNTIKNFIKNTIRDTSYQKTIMWFLFEAIERHKLSPHEGYELIQSLDISHVFDEAIYLWLHLLAKLTYPTYWDQLSEHHKEELFKKIKLMLNNVSHLQDPSPLLAIPLNLQTYFTPDEVIKFSQDIFAASKSDQSKNNLLGTLQTIILSDFSYTISEKVLQMIYNFLWQMSDKKRALVLMKVFAKKYPTEELLKQAQERQKQNIFNDPWFQQKLSEIVAILEQGQETKKEGF